MTVQWLMREHIAIPDSDDMTPFDFEAFCTLREQDLEQEMQKMRAERGY